MMSFTEYLQQRLKVGAFSTEDALASVLPLLRQVAALHAVGLVAPLRGIEVIRVDKQRLWFEEALALKPTAAVAKVRALEQPAARAVEIVGQYRVDNQVDHGVDQVVSLQIGTRGEPLTHPVYLPGYVSWEHELGQHDPLTDVFVLGLILGACAAGVDLNEPEDLAAFVQRRRNLFELNPQLHPVLAKAITRMTELERSRRPQDLAALVRMLENYRDQDVDFDFALARTPSFASADRRGKRALILSCLQQRLFEISRRNRLLHFRATAQVVNLTWASVPLAFDVQNVRPEQILTWGHAFQDALTAGGPVSLNKYLRFEEALYLPAQLDQIRQEARRDQTEFGFAQLRLVVCFLRWANLKEKPPQRYDSPLVLLPVRLAKNKGVRDVFTLEPTSTHAEINPVLRFYLKQLYAVDLPETIDLTQNSLADLHAHLASKVQASEPAVTVEMIDKPRINLIHAKAQRRLEQYRRRTRLSGRGVRSFLDLDYSYDRDNYHPLGLRLFQTRIAPSDTRLRMVVGDTPRPRAHMLPVEETAVPPALPALPALPDAEMSKERQLYSHAGEQTNPFQWEFDLCNVTLGNFHYRKMSLVRDYSELLDRDETHAGFDTIFSLEPRPAASAPPPLPLGERYPIVNCDPTQASALALARTGQHFIIQGPPGTGKSQTITNLIADFVAQGKRVLFVCEKRAAIDVVYHRLQQAGLQELCCLIHDAQDDKKEFIFDLKTTYEAFLATKEDRAARVEKERRQLLDRCQAELAPLERYAAAMRATPAPAGLPLLSLLQRAVALRHCSPKLAPAELERLPAYQLWHDHAAAIGRLCELLPLVQPDRVLAHHPLHSLHGRLGAAERPLEAIRAVLPNVQRLTAELLEALQPLAVPTECWDTLGKLRELLDYADALAFLAEPDLLSLLEPKSDRAKRLTTLRKQFTAKEKELERAQVATKAWRSKLAPADTQAALQQLRSQEHAFGRWFSLSWWRLRGVLQRSYDFASHAVPPSYSQTLEQLAREQQVAAELEQLEAGYRDEFAFADSFRAFADRVTGLGDGVDRLPAQLQTFHRQVVATARGAATVQALARLKPTFAQLLADAASLFADMHGLALPQLRDEANQVDAALDALPGFVPCLQELDALPAPLGDAWRRLPLAAEQLEAALAQRTAHEIIRTDPPLARFTGSVHAAHQDKLEALQEEWYAVSAQTVRERRCRHFLDHVRVASQPHGQLTAEQKEFKVQFNRGRRELEHEFSKTMRFRSIRDLVAGESGLVLRDLKPVWLMSPLSVSDALPLTCSFDVVIFDEASQVTLEEAVPALFRARQAIVVGDEMQLPPTSFFAAKATDDEESLVLEDASGKEVAYDLSSNSLLNHCARNLPATMLGWHYRSRSESLISFSNAAFYQGRLLTVPEVALPAQVDEIVITSPAAGFEMVDRLRERPVSFHVVATGVYEQRRNSAEADYIAQLVRGLLAEPNGQSLGIIAFSEAQQAEIEQALERLARTDDAFRSRLDAEWEREVDGQFVGLLVKNLENIQGDERDIIILSVCYAPAANGKMLMNFGPINQQGGERRLNVAFSRAKQHMAVVSSIRQRAITNDYNDGARALKNYLRYAEACSSGDAPAARRVLWEMNPASGVDSNVNAAPANVVVAQLAAELRERGYEVDTDVGQSSFRCDLAIRQPGEHRYRLGIIVDTDAYYENDNTLERAVQRPHLLRHFGWDIMLILTKNWFEDAAAVLAALDQRLAPPPLAKPRDRRSESRG